MRDKDFGDTEFFSGFDDDDRFGGGAVAGAKDQVVLGDEGEDFVHWGSGLPVFDDGNEGAIFARLFDLRFTVVGGEPDDPSAAAVHLDHFADRFGVESADGKIEGDSPENFDAADFLHGELGAVGGHGVMVFQDDGACLAPLATVGGRLQSR